MEVLVEFQGSKTELSLSGRDGVGEEIKKHLKLSATLLPFDKGTKTDASYRLQRYSTKWNQHIDVTSCSDVQDKDHLLVIKCTNEVKHSLSLCSKLAKPSESQAALGKLFSSSSQPCSSKFDPMKQCVAADKQRKKKAANTMTRPYKLWVVVMEKPQQKVPKGGSRKKLNDAGRVKRIEFRRCMSKQQVKNNLLKNFPTLNMDTCKFYTSDADTNLNLSSVEDFPNGQEVTEISSKESLYIVEGEEPNSDCDDLQFTPKTARMMAEADTILSKLKKPIDLLSSESESVDLTRDSDSEKEDIVAEQDREKIDQDKEIAKVQQEARKMKIKNLRRTLKQKFGAMEPIAQEDDSLWLSFRLPDSNRLDRVFLKTATTKVLYEFVFAQSDLKDGFALYHQVPRTLIPCSTSTHLYEVDICASTMFTVERCDQDLLVILDDNESKEPMTTLSTKNSMKLYEDSFEKFLTEVRNDRAVYLNEVGHEGSLHVVQRNHLIKSLIDLYESHEVDFEYPIRFAYENELAVDAGGVSRDVFGTFWEEIYQKYFDGVCCVIPSINPSVKMSFFHKIGRLLSHGYLAIGLLPVRISFPSLCTMLLGNDFEIEDSILIESFINYVSSREASVLQAALSTMAFSGQMVAKLTDILGAYSCFQIPSCENLRELLCKIAKCELIQKPLALLLQIHSGVISEHSQFWRKQEVKSLYKLYCCMTCTADKVLSQLESDPMSLVEQRTLRYLEQFVGNLKAKDLGTLLRFITGLPVCTEKGITVTFNGLSGLSRRPVAHTCQRQLELPTTYSSYTEFSVEMEAVLDMDTWPMDAI